MNTIIQLCAVLLKFLIIIVIIGMGCGLIISKPFYVIGRMLECLLRGLDEINNKNN